MTEPTLCGRCNKPKGKEEGCCKCGRPTEYSEEYIKKIDEDLESRQDESVSMVKQSNEEKGYEMYENKLKVKLPTIEGFARFIDTDKGLLYDWEKIYPEFHHALSKIRVEQFERLINAGLSGDYNSNIAKLILSSNHGMSEKTINEVIIPKPISDVLQDASVQENSQT